jgi:hypothetical protein
MWICGRRGSSLSGDGTEWSRHRGPNWTDRPRGKRVGAGERVRGLTMILERLCAFMIPVLACSILAEFSEHHPSLAGFGVARTPLQGLASPSSAAGGR